MIPVALVPRRVPLVPCAALAHGAVARRLADRLLRRDAAALLRVTGVAGSDLLLVLAEAAELPWVDGVVYLGREPTAPALLLPTTMTVSCPAPLLERRLIAEGFAAPIAVAGPPLLAVSAAAARPIAYAELLGWRGVAA